MRLGIPDLRREFVLPFQASINPGETKVMRQHPQAAFRGEQLIVSQGHECAIHAIRIGVKQQFAVDPIPALAFQDLTAVNLDVARVGESVELHVKNETGQPVAFSAALFGTVADDVGPNESAWAAADPTVADMKKAVDLLDEAYEPFGSEEAEQAFLVGCES